MIIISWNINGYRSAQKEGYIDKLYDLNPDVICLQETKLSNINQISNIPKEYYVYQQLSEDKGRNGVCIITKKLPDKIEDRIGYGIFDVQGRFIRCDFGEQISIINLYMPHGGRDKKDLPYKLDVGQNIIKYIEQIDVPIKIVCCDFNVAHKEIDVARAKFNGNNTMFTKDERKLIDQFMEHGFIDSFRYVNKEGGFYSWWPYGFNAKERNIGWRIDYIFVSQNVAFQIKNATLLKEFNGSDHCPMLLDIML